MIHLEFKELGSAGGTEALASVVGLVICEPAVIYLSGFEAENERLSAKGRDVFRLEKRLAVA